MSYYIGATGEYIWEELLDNTTSNVIISNHINFDANPLTDALQDIITDTLGTAVGELIAPITEVPSATGVGVVALTALGLLSYYKLNRTAVQDVDSMVYSADYASILTPGMFDDRVRIRYDNNWFSNAIYYEGGVKKGEILTSRINLLPTGTNDVNLYTSTGKVGIGTTPETKLHIYTGGDQATNIIRLETPVGGSSSIEFKRGTDLDVYADFRLIGINGIFRLQYENNELAYGDTGTDIISASKTQLTIYKPTDFINNVGIGTSPVTQLHIYNEVNPSIRIQSIAAGTPILDFQRGSVSDANKDYRFISENDIFKLQFQDATTYYPDNNNQLISINDTNTIIHKPTEFKANVLIGGDTKTIGYVGIGTTAAVPLHVYTAAANILRLQTAPVNGTNSIEFMRGNSTDPLTDYRLFTDTAGKFKIQYANNELAYGATDTDLIELSTTNTIIYKSTEMKGNVGIGTTAHATYKVDVNGTINATAFRGDGANITALNEANLILTTTKLYNNFNQTNFAIVDDKIDFPAQYSINITSYDSPTLYVPNDPRRLKGKMNVSYDDRQGLYKLEATNIAKTDNVAVLRYQVGDKISIRNTAENAKDFFLYDGFKYYMSVILVKRPSNQILSHFVDDAYSTILFEWKSSDGLEGRVPAFVMDYRQNPDKSYPFTTIMTFVVEAGFSYYLYKLWAQTEVSGGGTIYVDLRGFGDDYDDFNRAYGAGQTFKLRSDYVFSVNDYTPRTYTSAQAGLALQNTAGMIKPRRGMALDDEGGLSSVPISSDLITSMNTSHFTNNTGTNKIDISSSYVAPNATKLATARTIGGTSFDGSANIAVGLADTATKLATARTIGGTSFDGSANIAVGLADTATKLATARTIGGTSFDGSANIAVGLADTATKLATARTIGGTSFDGSANIAVGLADTATKLATARTIGGTSFDGSANIAVGLADTATKLATARDIAGVSFDGSAGINISYTNLTDKLVAGTGISIDTSVVPYKINSSVSAPTSATLIGILNTNDFVNNVGTSKIDLSPNTSNYVARIDTALGVRVDNTSNYVLRLDGQTSNYVANKQNIINSTAGQLIIGNGNGATTTNAGLTWTGGNMLNATNLTTTSGVYPNFIDCSSTIRGEELQVYGYALVVVGNSSTLMRISNNIYNELRVQQTLVAANDVKFSIFQKDNSVEYATPTITFYKGKLGIGTTTPTTYPLCVGGDINITGNYRINGALLDYFNLNNRPIILQPSTTNLQLVSGYTLSVPGNVAIGTTAIATNVLQVGAGGRLRISNGATDYTLLGTLDTDGATNTSIVISGNTRSTNAGNIQYLATASGGSHIFYTASATTRMTISSSGVNVNNDLGVSGNVGVGVAPATYKLNVSGDINCTGAFRVNGTAITNSWSAGTPTNSICYTLGNVGIGTNNPVNIFQVGSGGRLRIANGTSDYTIIGTKDIDSDTNTRIAIIGNTYGSGLSGEIHYIATSTGSHVFYTTDTKQERMRITSGGNVCIGASTTSDVDDNTAFAMPTATLYVKGGASVGGICDVVIRGGVAGGEQGKARLWLTSDAAHSSYIQSIHTGSGNTTLSFGTSSGNALPTERMSITNTGVVSIAGTMSCNNGRCSGDLEVGGNRLMVRGTNPTLYLRDTDHRSGMVHMNTNSMFFLCASGNDSETWTIQANNSWPLVIDMNNNNASFGGQIYAYFIAVANTNTDYLCVQQNYGDGAAAFNWIKVAYGSFTAFHRCYTDDVLYNNTTDEDIDLFKNKYMGRVVIATGKIKTDLSKQKETDEEPELDPLSGLPKPQNKEDEWYTGIDKDGISIEDAIPVVALSRKKKDKRVFGVLGAPKRSTNNKDRLIVNSIGEGAICVANTNGNIENGDYLQSSDLLGYAERQDDDITRNYTIGKATIDCDFQLDSPYYQAHEIENGVRVAFIACTYCCG